MTRIDIADYLGLTIETVSRTFTRLHAEGLIDIVSQCGLVICDPVGLEGLAGGMPCYDTCVPAGPANSSPMPDRVRSNFARRNSDRVSPSVG